MPTVKGAGKTEVNLEARDNVVIVELHHPAFEHKPSVTLTVEQARRLADHLNEQATAAEAKASAKAAQ